MPQPNLVKFVLFQKLLVSKPIGEIIRIRETR